MSIQASAGTIRQHREHFNIRFNQYKDIPIDKISKQDLIDWRIWLAQQPFSTKTKNTTITYVKGVLRYAAVTYDIPDYSPILTKLKKSDVELMGEPEIWTPDEFSKFINCVEDGCALCRKSLEIRAFSYFGLGFELEIGHVRMIFESGVSQLKHGS